jgi:hypothetical protein
MLLGDFHIHSNFSDGQLTIPQVVDFFAARKIHVIAITDHLCESKTWLGKAAKVLGMTLTPATFPLYINLIRHESKRAMDRYGMVVLPGYEITKNAISSQHSAHLLVLGVERWISADLEIEEICRQAKEEGGIAVAAHPVYTGKLEQQTFHLWNRRDELAHLIDAWETTREHVVLKKVTASGLPLISNSDFHKPTEFYGWKTVIHAEPSLSGVLEAIRNQQLAFCHVRGEHHDLELDSEPRNSFVDLLTFTRGAGLIPGLQAI